MKSELLKGLTEEQLELAKKCESTEELLALAKAEGVELTDEQMAAVTGSCDTRVLPVCPKCGCTEYIETMNDGIGYYECKGCGTKYNGLLQYS
ncbi:hypothetical protein PED39_02120 [Methanomassiliicoccales archaeon LGM-RCC1]|jgi:tRNA(Ile2) C34 agmatinyltransferase TiaS|nr:hypothetical protein [Candidatus Methanomethylophilaceae archaeon]WII08014.1 hypothetical protein PED39_02120 [Methanomassiliicoccales archaeon LGM-RCC1]